jgi:hypothetical protein
MLQLHAKERIEFLKHKTVPQRLTGASAANERKNWRKQCIDQFKVVQEVKGTAMVDVLMRKHKTKSVSNPARPKGEEIWKIQVIAEKMEEFITAQHLLYCHLGGSNLLNKMRETYSFHPGKHPDAEMKEKNWIEKEVQRICDACKECQLPKDSKV